MLWNPRYLHKSVIMVQEALLLDGNSTNWIRSKYLANHDHQRSYATKDGIDGSQSELYAGYDLRGQVINGHRRWSLPANTSNQSNPEISFQVNYDHAGRFKSRVMQHDNTETIIAQASYNGTGQMIEMRPVLSFQVDQKFMDGFGE